MRERDHVAAGFVVERQNNLAAIAANLPSPISAGSADLDLVRGPSSHSRSWLSIITLLVFGEDGDSNLRSGTRFFAISDFGKAG